VKAAFGRLSSYYASEFGNNGTNHPRTQLACIKEDAKMRHAKPQPIRNKIDLVTSAGFES
jgi:hypothetical protein